MSKQQGSTPRRRDPAAIAEWLGQVHRSVEQVLDEIRAQPHNARRSVTRELGLEPRPAMLRAIVRLARDGATSGPRHALPRRLLALHTLAERELAELLDAPRPEGRRLRESGRNLAALLHAVRDIKDDLRSALGKSTDDDRRFLVEVADALALPENRLVAATVLAPRLEILIEEAGKGEVRTAIPSLSAEEAELLDRIGGDPDHGLPGCRASINAIALRTLIVEDLDRLATLEGREPRAAPSRSRKAVLDRLRRNIVAYRVVDERLREQQDAAIAAGLECFAEEIDRVKSELFAAQLKMLPVFRRNAAS